jgi:hypothetical protein
MLMKKLLLLAAFALLAFGQDFVSTSIGTFYPPPRDIAREDISKVDFSTNKTTAKVWSELSTNSIVRRNNRNWTYAVYCEGGCPEVFEFTRTTTVLLTRFAEVEGIRVQLNARPVYQTNETFTVPTQ